MAILTLRSRTTGATPNPTPGGPTVVCTHYLGVDSRGVSWTVSEPTTGTDRPPRRRSSPSVLLRTPLDHDSSKPVRVPQVADLDLVHWSYPPTSRHRRCPRTLEGPPEIGGTREEGGGDPSGGTDEVGETGGDGPYRMTRLVLTKKG